MYLSKAEESRPGRLQYFDRDLNILSSDQVMFCFETYMLLRKFIGYYENND